MTEAQEAQEALFAEPAPAAPVAGHAPPVSATSAVVEYVAGQLAHFSGVRKATPAQREKLEGIAARALEEARAVIRP